MHTTFGSLSRAKQRRPNRMGAVLKGSVSTLPIERQLRLTDCSLTKSKSQATKYNRPPHVCSKKNRFEATLERGQSPAQADDVISKWGFLGGKHIQGRATQPSFFQSTKKSCENRDASRGSQTRRRHDWGRYLSMG